MRLLFLALGFASLAAGAIGAFLPLLPTVPFVLLAALCFGKGSPRVEHWLVGHKLFGPQIQSWRHSRTISRAGKRAALLAFASSAAAGLILLSVPWSLVSVVTAVAGSLWVSSLPTAPVAASPEGRKGQPHPAASAEKPFC